ncbi:MAG: insulinase family protein [Bacteroidales bacterium]|nr:insulinase family protein [Bacteroidales bacterium]NLK81798.1 insulinase family protein [Bacteroidales bacterium]HPY82465.1 pitrilysin family protein [Bacteroidales bacterium]
MKREEFYIINSNTPVIITQVQSQVSHIGLLIHTGSRDDTLETSGRMHMIEHMLFKGTKKRSYLQLLDYIESVGGDINAYTSKEETCIYISIHNEYVERAIDVLSDIFYSTVFTKQELDKEKEVVIDEIQSYKDSPQENIFDEFEEKLFAPHELSWNILGNETTIENLTVENLTDIYNKQYVSHNSIISYVGGVNSKKIKKLTQSFFEEEKKSKDCTSTHKRTTFLHSNLFSEKSNRQTYQAHCMLGTSAPSMHNSLKTAMILLNNLLGGSCFNSQLNLLLREEHGLTYNIESNYTAYTDTGIFSIYFGTDVSKIEQCKNLLFEKFKKIRAVGIRSSLLEMYKKQLIGQFALSFDNHVAYMISNAKSYMNYKHVDTYNESVKKIQNITNQNIIELATQVLHPDTLSELIYV